MSSQSQKSGKAISPFLSDRVTFLKTGKFNQTSSFLWCVQLFTSPGFVLGLHLSQNQFCGRLTRCVCVCAYVHVCACVPLENLAAPTTSPWGMVKPCLRVTGPPSGGFASSGSQHPSSAKTTHWFTVMVWLLSGSYRDFAFVSFYVCVCAHSVVCSEVYYSEWKVSFSHSVNMVLIHKIIPIVIIVKINK